MAEAFGAEGMSVMLADIEESALQRALAGLRERQIRAEGVVADVASRASVQTAAQAAVAAFGKVHVVCNNAGVATGGPLGQIADGDWEWIVDVNLKGVVYGVETFAPLIQSHGEGGHIVNTASIAGLVSGAGSEPYSATKYAVVAMSEGWAQQLAPTGVGLSVLCPGYVRTRIASSARNRQDRYGEHADDGFAGAGTAVAHAVDEGLDPGVVGKRVVEAVRNGDLYIFTDPRFREIVEYRFAAIRAGFDAAAASPALKAVKDWAPLMRAPQTEA